MMKKFSLWRRSLIVLMICIGIMAASLIGTAIAEANAGIDLYIVMDDTKSLLTQGNDKEAERLDAATMMVNMCDSKFSRVAVIPFTDKIETGAMFGKLVDVSDKNDRVRLCEAILTMDPNKHNNASGLTNPEAAFQAVLDLVIEQENAGSGNQPVLLFLTDGSIQNTGARARSIEIVRDMRENHGVHTYSVYLNTHPNTNDQYDSLLTCIDIAGESDHMLPGTSDEMVRFFSDIFADLIDSRKQTETVTIANGIADIPITVRNNSVFEINLVFPTKLVAKNARIEVKDPSGVSAGGDQVYTYEKRAAKEKDGYDYYSLKLMNPQQGTWHVNFPAAPEAVDQQFTYDILYNYDVALAAEISDTVRYFNQDVKITGYFIKTDGTNARSNDGALYEIPATLTLHAPDGSPIPGYTDVPMTKSAEGNSYEYTITMADLRNIGCSYGSYTATIHAEDETMYRDSVEPVGFSIVDATPVLVNGDTEEDLGLIRIADVLNPDTEDGKAEHSIAGYASDEDGDVVSYEITGVSDNITATLEGTQLTITKNGEGNVTDGYVEIKGKDPQGNYTAETARFIVDVLSVRTLVENCVNVELTADGEELYKGDTITITANYKVELPQDANAAELPWCYMNEVLTTDALKAVATAAFSYEGDEGIEFTGEGYTATVTAAETDGAACTVGFNVAISDIVKTANTLEYKVKNAPPVAEDITGAIEEIGGVKETIADGSEVLFLNVDKDKADAAVLDFDLTTWFSDFDAGRNKDALNYSVTIKPLEETKDLFRFARAFLRMIGMTEKEGEIITLEGGAMDEETGIVTAGTESTLKLDPKRFGNAIVEVTAKDRLGAEPAVQTIGYHVTSSTEQLKCIIVYAVWAIILLILIILFIHNFIVRQPWWKGNYSVTMGGYSLYAKKDGKETSPFNRRGRGRCTLADFMRQFSVTGDISRAGLNRITLEPRMGKNILVDVSKLKGAEVKIGGRPVKKKAKWNMAGKLECIYKDADGNQNTLEFRLR